jgi:hypothetical protein
MAASDPTKLCFEGFTLDLAARTLVDASGREVALRRSEYELLRAFLAAPGRALGRDHLLDAVASRRSEPFLGAALSPPSTRHRAAPLGGHPAAENAAGEVSCAGSLPQCCCSPSPRRSRAASSRSPGPTTAVTAAAGATTIRAAATKPELWIRVEGIPKESKV